MENKIYQPIISHYESCLDKHGDSHLGVDWPKLEDVHKRYEVMLELTRFVKNRAPNYELLDFGCGAGHLLEYISNRGYANQFHYTGIDISAKFVSLCRKKFPNFSFEVMDVLQDDSGLGQFDLVIMNGVFTEKRELTFDQMWHYFISLITVVYKHATTGVAFNVMSKHVDWERDDLFHLPFDMLTAFLIKNLSRNFIVRNDYGLYEYTVYLYK